MVKIRLAQTGTTNRKTYRIVAIEEGKRRDGRAIETLGYFNPLVKPPKFVINQERIDYWLSVGAQPTGAIIKLLKNRPS